MIKKIFGLDPSLLLLNLIHAGMKQPFMVENMGLFQTVHMILQDIKPPVVNYYLEMAQAIITSFPRI